MNNKPIRPHRFTKTQIAVIRALAQCRLSPSKAAREVYISTNGVVYHIENIHKKTGLNPRDFYDLEALLAAVSEQEAAERRGSDGGN